ncbi:FxSxx-COOH system tetratricopeptide repeat protein [Streptomyces sp. NPDC059499]|uniref:FxSxx-COOH system tetratricopeptide repeat protein n=1 Tax=Streptomyces sp. NPDC059499 TaxID=3346852 RepID=UPI00367D2A3E
MTRDGWGGTASGDVAGGWDDGDTFGGAEGLRVVGTSAGSGEFGAAAGAAVAGPGAGGAQVPGARSGAAGGGVPGARSEDGTGGYGTGGQGAGEAGAGEPGTVVTFYSFKGGVGRTMALVNTAWILASNGLRVLIIDWDLEAPGLHRYFHPLLVDPELGSTKGVIDLIRDYSMRASGPGPELLPGGRVDWDRWFRDHSDVDDCIVGVRMDFADDGRLDFLPAGLQNDGYSAAVSTFDWDHFYTQLRGAEFLTALRDELSERYDYVLIDSRTGLSDTAGICTILLPDVVVDSFTLSAQSIQGAAAVAESVRAQATMRPIRILPAPMRVEYAEQNKLEAGRDLARSRFQSFLGSMTREERDLYWGDVEIPYRPFFAYEEIPAPVGDRPHQGNSLLAASERLTGRITGGRVTKQRPMPETMRRALLASYERTKAPIPSDIFLSYAPADRMWAEWIGARLTATGYQVALSGSAEHAGADTMTDVRLALAGSGRIVVLLSPDFVRLPHAHELWKSVSSRDPEASQRMLIPIRVHDAPLPAPFAGLVAVDLVERGQEEAEQALLAAVGRPDNVAGTLRTPGRTATDEESGPRYPGVVPRVWHVPSRNPSFTGRAGTLEQMRNGFAASGLQGGPPQAVFGLGGVGKTQVAIEYAHRFAADYDAVWWIAAGQPGLVRQELAALAVELGLPVGDDVATTAAAVLEALRQGRPYRRWLLVYDNAERPEELAPLIPAGPGHVLVTSRNRAWVALAVQVEVHVFTRDESVRLLRRQNPNLTDTEAGQVAEALGDLPLAVGQAAAWLEQSAMPVETYLRLLETQLTQMLEQEPPTSYPRSAAATWLLSLAAMREATPAAALLLEICAFFGPDPIPMWTLYGSRTAELLEQYDDRLDDPMRMGRLFTDINRYGLARTDQGDRTISVHRLVQEVLRSQVPRERWAEMRAHVHAILAEANPGYAEDPASWGRHAALLPHMAPSRAFSSRSARVRRWVVDAVRYLWRRSDHSAALETAERALGLWVPVFGDGDSLVILMRCQQANALRSAGKLAEAHALGMEVWEQARESLGEDDEYTLIAAGNLGADLRSTGAYTKARDIDRETYRVSQRVHGLRTPRTLSAANNLAVSLFLSGDRQGARELDRYVYETRREVLGATHPYTLTSASNYARDLRETGAPEQALKLLQETVAAFRERTGDKHPETLSAARNLAAVLRRTGQYEAARALSADIYDTYMSVLGPDHPDTLSAATNLACALVATGDAQGARALAQDALDRHRTQLGERHPFALACANNLAVYLRLTGARDAALAMSRRTFQQYREVLGAANPYTLTSMMNHATDLVTNNRTAEAVALERAAYADFVRILTADHYDAIGCASNLAIDLRATGATDEAAALHQDALERAAATMGAEHPTTLTVQAWGRLDSDIEPPAP